MKLSEMDVVYVVRPTRDGNIDLRYSLRSLKNLPHRNVWIYCSEPAPLWLTNVNLVENDNRDQTTKFENVNRKLIAACDNKEITKEFILMNDDFFIMKPVRKLPNYALGPTLMERFQKCLRIGTYAVDLLRAAQELLELGQTDIDFEIHAPMVFNRARMLKILENYPETGHRRTLYGNIYNLKPTYEGDFKIYRNQDLDKSKRFISTTEDALATMPDVARFIFDTFKEPSKFER
jgi:hypothetical protein